MLYKREREQKKLKAQFVNEAFNQLVVGGWLRMARTLIKLGRMVRRVL